MAARHVGPSKGPDWCRVTQNSLRKAASTPGEGERQRRQGVTQCFSTGAEDQEQGNRITLALCTESQLPLHLRRSGTFGGYWGVCDTPGPTLLKGVQPQDGLAHSDWTYIKGKPWGAWAASGKVAEIPCLSKERPRASMDTTILVILVYSFLYVSHMLLISELQ